MLVLIYLYMPRLLPILSLGIFAWSVSKDLPPMRGLLTAFSGGGG